MEDYFFSLPETKCFTKIFTSYRLGFRKPDPKIYQLAFDGLNFSKESILFIDDLPENIAAAQAFGFQAEQSVYSLEKFKEILKNYRLI